VVQTIARCKSCGLPIMASENMEWLPDGTIMTRRLKGVRLVVLDQEMTARIMGALASQERGDLKAQIKGATRYVVGKMFSGLIGKLPRYDVVKKRLLEAMEGFSLLLGMGRMEVERLAPAQEGRILLKKPFDLCLATAVIMGVLEETDRCFYAFEHEREGRSDYRLTLEAVEEGAYSPDPFAWLPIQYQGRKGSFDMERCRDCGLPLAVREFVWDELSGTVNIGGGRCRVGFLPWYITAVMAHMAGCEEAGGYAALLEEASCLSALSALQSMEGGAGNAYIGEPDLWKRPHGDKRRLAGEVLAVRGWGMVEEFEMGAREWKMTVKNPVDAALVAGWLRALYTFTLGREPRLKVTEDIDVARCVLK